MVLFESPAGEDPLSDSECDLDSVAGVLKLYFRGLEPPLFPYESYGPLLECVRKKPSRDLRATSVSELTLSFSVFLLLRTLFCSQTTSADLVLF